MERAHNLMWTLEQLKSIFKKGEEHSDSAVVVWPVVYPGGYLPPKDPHVTILYIPDVVDVQFTKEDVINAIKATDFEVFPVARVKSLEMFGPEKDVPVLSLEHNYLEEYYRQLRSQFLQRDITYSDKYEYSPHVTISPEAAREVLWPLQFTLTPVQLWWRNEKIRIHK